jgi:hypothetical protein
MQEKSNLLVGYFAHGGDFTSIVGIGHSRWWKDYYSNAAT